MGQLAVGKHIVTVTSALLIESQSKGTPGIQFGFVCGTAPDGECSITTDRYLAPGNRDYFIRDLQTLGYTDEMLKDPTNIQRVAEITVGKECSITVAEEEYKGELKRVVKYINPVGPVGSSDTANKLWSIMQGANAAVPPPPPPPAKRKDGLVSGPRQKAQPEPEPFAPPMDEPF